MLGTATFAQPLSPLHSDSGLTAHSETLHGMVFPSTKRACAGCPPSGLLQQPVPLVAASLTVCSLSLSIQTEIPEVRDQLPHRSVHTAVSEQANEWMNKRTHEL